MPILDQVYTAVDFPFKFRNRILRKIMRMSSYSSNQSNSDSQETFYETTIARIIDSDRKLRRFRRIYNYREILEHLDYQMGMEYVTGLDSNKLRTIANHPNVVKADFLGKPRRFKYNGIGKISPTTLRYIATAFDIDSKIKLSKIETIVEIGAGYGGQINIINSLYPGKRYLVFDLPKVQKLINYFLTSISPINVSMEDIRNYRSTKVDLVISNYAFSELPKELQVEYLETVISNSKNGYMLMNSGLTDFTGRSSGKVSLEEIKKYLPHAEVLPEVPLTSPDNYLLIWRNAE